MYFGAKSCKSYRNCDSVISAEMSELTKQYTIYMLTKNIHNSKIFACKRRDYREVTLAPTMSWLATVESYLVEREADSVVSNFIC